MNIFFSPSQCLDRTVHMSPDTYQVQDLASEVESVEAVHDLLDARVPVPLRHHVNDMPGRNMNSVLTQCT